MKKKSVLALGLVLTMSVSMVGCGSSKKTETEKVNVEVQTPQSGEVTLDTDYIGTVSPEQQVYVVPLVSGTVTQVNYAVGDTVKEGDVLFRIDDEAAQLQVDKPGRPTARPGRGQRGDRRRPDTCKIIRQSRVSTVWRTAWIRCGTALRIWKAR